MPLRTRPALWWRSAIVLSAGLGLITGTNSLVYFTVESNVLVLGYFVGAVFWMVRNGSADAPAPRLRGAVTLYILITGLVAHIILNHGASPLPGLTHGSGADRLQSWSLLLLHYTTPIMVVLDWLCFGPRNASRWRDLPLWLSFPLGYAALTELRAVLFPFFPNRYPYFFLDPTGHGYGWVGLQIVQLTVEFVALAALLVGLDRLGTRVRGALFGRGQDAEAPQAAEASETVEVADVAEVVETVQTS
ncbi:Pr6Pr family membrane protein [Streptacidiphilus fuscans]|uniref:Pr6Pr family membrane protein n=1 Tax=Streptacidiphilus fuscans TaxID=2789292 RepID=A0A931FHA6_9ACTN|nr:Pr6Pr family membrane protein [Streptacidiphilus fuscans]MBF9070459.1 Pr6Pr family membrane protein [Streptacidiphilus fuscans]